MYYFSQRQLVYSLAFRYMINAISYVISTSNFPVRATVFYDFINSGFFVLYLIVYVITSSTVVEVFTLFFSYSFRT